jgi:predicted nucleic-acid-binding Zn-ribbon protein
VFWDVLVTTCPKCGARVYKKHIAQITTKEGKLSPSAMAKYIKNLKV